MLAAAMLNVMPEAFELNKGSAEPLFITLFAAMLAFYFLERVAIWRHAHAHDEQSQLRAVPWVVVLGDGIHNFVDGVLIAAAFLVDPWLGATTALAVFAHELPQELGDFALLLSAGWTKKKALLGNAASGAAAVVGGVVGWWALSDAQNLLPYALMIAAASFIYIAVADLFPYLHRRHHIDGFVPQTALLAAGVATISLVGHVLHHH